ncbi:MAG TPA: hypothetical protein VG897_18755 [Terriglobales bacterium]|nr:hypothetical protein [Terriglobales bacterium]
MGLFLLAGCGTPGAPQPPSLRVPKPVDDLTATRKGDRVLLTWTPPTKTTDGENIRHAGSTEVCRGVGAFPMIRCGENVATLKDAQVEHWTKGTLAARKDYSDTLPESLQQQSPLGEATYALQDFNTHGRTAGLSNQVRVPLAPTLPPPAEVNAKVVADGVELSWPETRSAINNPAIHFVYRIFRHSATDQQKPEVIAGEVPFTDEPTTSFVDRNIDWEQRYVYRVAPITEVQQSGKELVEVEGDDSPAVEAFAHDVFPPATPTGLQAVFSGVGQKPFIDLTWAPNLESDLAGYNVYRHDPGAAPVKINPDLVKTPAFRDTNVQPGHEYFYSVSAVDQRGNESAKSEETSEKAPE